MIERRIKELSIALEALSRINGEQASVHKDSIEMLLSGLIRQAEKEQEKIAPYRTHSTTDEEIPL